MNSAISNNGKYNWIHFLSLHGKIVFNNLKIQIWKTQVYLTGIVGSSFWNWIYTGKSYLKKSKILFSTEDLQYIRVSIICNYSPIVITWWKFKVWLLCILYKAKYIQGQPFLFSVPCVLMDSLLRGKKRNRVRVSILEVVHGSVSSVWKHHHSREFL